MFIVTKFTMGKYVRQTFYALKRIKISSKRKDFWVANVACKHYTSSLVISIQVSYIELGHKITDISLTTSPNGTVWNDPPFTADSSHGVCII